MHWTTSRLFLSPEENKGNVNACKFEDFNYIPHNVYYMLVNRVFIRHRRLENCLFTALRRGASF